MSLTPPPFCEIARTPRLGRPAFAPWGWGNTDGLGGLALRRRRDARQCQQGSGGPGPRGGRSRGRCDGHVGPTRTGHPRQQHAPDQPLKEYGCVLLRPRRTDLCLHGAALRCVVAAKRVLARALFGLPAPPTEEAAQSCVSVANIRENGCGPNVTRSRGVPVRNPRRRPLAAPSRHHALGAARQRETARRKRGLPGGTSRSPLRTPLACKGLGFPPARVRKPPRWM